MPTLPQQKIGTLLESETSTTPSFRSIYFSHGGKCAAKIITQKKFSFNYALNIDADF